MEKYIIMYLIFQTSLPSERGGVGRADLARYLQVTPKTAAAKVKPLIAEGLVDGFRQGVPRGLGFRWEYALTDEGFDFLRENKAEIREMFGVWQDLRFAALMKGLSGKSAKQTTSKKCAEALKAGQKEMFVDDE